MDHKGPVAGASVCAATRGGLQTCTTTSADGAYAIENLSATAYRVTALAAQHRPATFGVGTRAGSWLVLGVGEARDKVDFVLRAGVLLSGELPMNPRVNQAPPIAVVQSAVQVTTPGKVKLRFDSAKDLSFWVDGRRVEPAADDPDALALDLDRGVHTLSVAFEPGHRPDGLRCVLEDVAGSSAQALPVLGK